MRSTTQICNTLRASSPIWASEASSEAARGRGKESLQRSLIKFHLYFAQTKVNTIGWKMTFRKTKLIDNSPSWHLFRLCVKFGSQRDQTGTENLFQPSKQTRGLVWFSISQREYCEPRISRTEFIVLVEGKWKPFISCIRLCQAPCLVLKTRRVKVKRDSSARFKRCLPTSVSSPDWIPLGRKIRKHVLDSAAV